MGHPPINKLEKILPELVHEVINPPSLLLNGKTEGDPIPFKAMDYMSIIPIIVKGMQEQQTEILNQGILIQELIKQLSTNISTEGNKKNYLLQNKPNPFSGTTTISFDISELAQFGFIRITSLDTRTSREFKIDPSQKSLEINSSEFSSGEYIYSLILDGKVADSKKMIITK